MTKLHRCRRVLLCCQALWISGCLISLALWPVSTARAQALPTTGNVDTGGLVIEAVAGWDGTVDRSTAVPLSFLLSNFTETVIEGKLILTDNLGGHELLLGEIYLSPGATRRFTSIQAMTDWYECIATFRDDTQVLWRRELSLNTANEFVTNMNFALVINDSTRRLHLPEVVPSASASAAAESAIAEQAGRPVACLSVKSWQIPNHSGPLCSAQAMIFLDGTDVDRLNRIQWQAVADWMCQGGIVYIHQQSTEMLQRLTALAPLKGELAQTSGDFTIRRVGLGAIYEYGTPLFTDDAINTKQQMAETIAKLGKQHINTFVRPQSFRYQRGGRADANRVLVLSFFGAYMFFSGLVTLLLFRKSRRRIAIYTVTVVGTACVVSGLLGGMLRLSPGDLNWVTVTQAGAGGVVQVGKLHVQSAGGRNTQVAIQGIHPDLQYIEEERRYYSWNVPRTGFPPFTWQPSLAVNEDDVYQIGVPITPWGRRRLQATGFQSDIRPMDFKLDFLPSEDRESLGVPSGKFSLTLVNHLPFDVIECWLIVGTTKPPSAQAAANPVKTIIVPQRGLRRRNIVTVVKNDPLDVYHLHRLQNVSSGASYSADFVADFKQISGNWPSSGTWPSGLINHPQISRKGIVDAWIYGRIAASPVLTIDRQRSDFVVQEQDHFYVQQIRPEDLPASFRALE